MKAWSTSLWLLALLILACQVKCIDVGVGFSGYWGQWIKSGYGPIDNKYAFCGAELRFEPNQGSGDDTAANGVRFVSCSRQDWNNQISHRQDGEWGDWMGVKMCPYGMWVTSFRVRAEAPLGSNGDDTALNGLQIYCEDLASRYQSYVMVYEGLWGDWSEWYSVPGQGQPGNKKYFFYRAYLRFEDALIWGGDDTALNGIKMEAISWNV